MTDSRKRCCTCSAKNKLEVRREGCTNLPCGVEFCGYRSQDGAAITQDRGSRCQRWLIKCDGLQPLLPPKQWITLSAIILQNKSSCSSHQDPTGNLKWGIYIQGQSMTAQPQGWQRALNPDSRSELDRLKEKTRHKRVSNPVTRKHGMIEGQNQMVIPF